MPKHLKKLTEETLHENPWWKYKHDTYEKPNGEVGDYYYSDNVDAVIIVPIYQDKKIGLVLQYRYLEQRPSIEFPAGGIEATDSVLDAAKRELKEEMGLIAEEWISVGSFYPTNSISKSNMHVFIAYVSEQQVQELDSTEEIELLSRRSDELAQMIERGEIKDGCTLAAWSLVRHYFVA